MCESHGIEALPIARGLPRKNLKQSLQIIITIISLCGRLMSFACQSNVNTEAPIMVAFVVVDESNCKISFKKCPDRFGTWLVRNPSVSKSNRLHVVIFRFLFINVKYVLYILLKESIFSFEVLNFNWLFLKINKFACNYTGYLDWY